MMIFGKPTNQQYVTLYNPDTQQFTFQNNNQLGVLSSILSLSNTMGNPPAPISLASLFGSQTRAQQPVQVSIDPRYTRAGQSQGDPLAMYQNYRNSGMTPSQFLDKNSSSVPTTPNVSINQLANTQQSTVPNMFSASSGTGAK